MRQYTITKVNGAPDWSKIPTLDVDNYLWCEELDIKMKSQICYCEEGLHVHLRAWEKDIRAELTEPMSMVCEDSCMEFFFRPMEGDLRYFNLEINPNGQMYIGFGHNMTDLIRLALQDEQGMLQKKWNYTEDGWEVFYTFPVSVIQVFFPGYALKSGMKIYANSYKCGDETVKPHFIAWNPVEVTVPSFHEPEHFGLMILE
jgi:hypothetical protein